MKSEKMEGENQDSTNLKVKEQDKIEVEEEKDLK
jgi:hypothetical protein